ncbi:MAG: dihydroorotase [Oscillospiraceae bacterium]|nr:dihydroorotase [Oscillospiraceae bacterium]
MQIVITGACVYQDAKFKKADLLITDGIITAIGGGFSVSPTAQVFSFDDCLLIPGFADVHVHLREPGFSYKETIASGTLAAARSGYSVLCAMPNLSPPPDSPEHIALEWEIIRRDAHIRVLPYACITIGQAGGGELVDFEALKPLSFAFSDDGRGVQSEETMREAMRRVRAVGGMICAHCEDNSLLHGGYIHDGDYARAHGHRGISSESEYEQIARDIELVRETGCRYHVCHISTYQSVELLRQAKKEGLPVSCETGPHYLTLTDADLQEDGRFKMNPPLRSLRDREALIEGLLDGTIDVIATDHAPHSREEKSRGLEKSAMGIPGLETAFPVLYTKLVKPGIVPLETIIEKMAAAPRRLFSLGPQLEIGAKADLAVLDIRKPYTIRQENFATHGFGSPFEGMEVYGKCVMNIADGRIVWQRNSTEN